MSHSTKKDKILDPIYELVGEIKHKSDEDVTFVKIIGTFYDRDGKVVGTRSTYTDPSDIKPDRTAPYSLTIGFGDSIDIKYRKCNLQFGMGLRHQISVSY